MQSKNLIINILIYRFMNNNELLKKYAGISTCIRRTFAYHYDQILIIKKHSKNKLLGQK